MTPSQGLDVLEQEYIEIPLSECIRGFSADNPSAEQNQYMAPRPYQYGIKIEFERGKGVDFVNQRDFPGNFFSMSNTANEMMNDVLALETIRDMDTHADNGYDMSDEDYSALLKDMNDSTLSDTELILEDLTAIFQQTYPDSGITGVSLSYMQGMDEVCMPPEPEDIMQASAPDMGGDLLADMPAARPALTALKR